MKHKFLKILSFPVLGLISLNTYAACAVDGKVTYVWGSTATPQEDSGGDLLFYLDAGDKMYIGYSSNMLANKVFISTSYSDVKVSVEKESEDCATAPLFTDKDGKEWYSVGENAQSPIDKATVFPPDCYPGLSTLGQFVYSNPKTDLLRSFRLIQEQGNNFTPDMVGIDVNGCYNYYPKLEEES